MQSGLVLARMPSCEELEHQVGGRPTAWDEPVGLVQPAHQNVRWQRPSTSPSAYGALVVGAHKTCNTLQSTRYPGPGNHLVRERQTQMSSHVATLGAKSSGP